MSFTQTLHLFYFSLLIICVCAYVCVHYYMSCTWCILVSVGVCTYTRVESKTHQNRCFIFETSLPLNLKSIDLARVAGQWASWVFLSPPTPPIPTVLEFQAHAALPDLCRAGALNSAHQVLYLPPEVSPQLLKHCDWEPSMLTS